MLLSFWGSKLTLVLLFLLKFEPDTAFLAPSTGQRLVLAPGLYWNCNSSKGCSAGLTKLPVNSVLFFFEIRRLVFITQV